VALPVTPSFWLSFKAISSDFTSPLTTVEFSQAARSSVVDTTNLRAPFITAVNGSSGSAFGQYAANSSYVCRPRRVASLSAMSWPTTAPISSSKLSPANFLAHTDEKGGPNEVCCRPSGGPTLPT